MYEIFYITEHQVSNSNFCITNHHHVSNIIEHRVQLISTSSEQQHHHREGKGGGPELVPKSGCSRRDGENERIRVDMMGDVG
jgi:hypothetical protein